MVKKWSVRTFVQICILFILAFLAPAVKANSSSSVLSTGGLIQSSGIRPEEIVIISNEGDARYCRNFSINLKWSALDWVILDEASIPDEARDRHLLLIGQPDSQYSGALIDELTTPEERDQIQGESGYAVISKVNPWHPGRQILIAVGIDSEATRRAAEEALAGLMQGAGELEEWYAEPYENVTREQAVSYVESIQHLAGGDGLPRDMLEIALKVRTPLRISSELAVEDVERFFYLLEYGWCGYGFFSSRGDFAQAKEDILKKLGSKSGWTPGALNELIYQELDFVHDCHLKLGDQSFCRHLDFWYAEDMDITQVDEGYTLIIDGHEYRLLSVNGQGPEAYLFPSLNATGSPVYRLGTLTYDAPEPLAAVIQGGDEQLQLEVPLSSSEFHSDEIFGEERIGGIPVIRVRSFADYYRGRELDEFLESARRYRGEPYVILDLRQNSGGNTDWPKNWVTRFTGHTPAFNFILSELTNRTTMMGRLNAFELALQNSPSESSSWVQGQINAYQRRAEQYDDPSLQPGWTPLKIPSSRWIPNESTLIVLMDRNVASAGEGMILYLYGQVQNVVFVGENSHGALTFGQVSNHRLPNSKLLVWVPIKLNVSRDLVFREERGYEPDLWVPAPEALNYAVAAARSGTLGTQVDLPPDFFASEFVPEKVNGNRLLATLVQYRWMVILIAVGAFSLIVFRNIPLFYIGLGMACLPTSVIMIFKDDPQGYLLIAYGLTFLFIGVYRRRKGKSQPPVQSLQGD